MKMRLLQKMLIFLLTPAMIGFLFITIASFLQAQKALERQIDSELDIIANLQARATVNVTQILTNIINNSSSLPSIRGYLQIANIEENVSSQPVLNAALTKIIQDYNLIKDIGLLNNKGIIIGHTSPENSIGKDLSQRTYFVQSMRGESGIQNVYSKVSGDFTTIMSSPVKVDSKPIGVLYGVLDLKALSSEMSKSIQIGQTGQFFVLDDTGKVIMHSDSGQFGDGNLSSMDFVKTIVSTKNGHLIASIDNKEKLIYFSAIPNMNWIFAVSIDLDEATAPAASLFKDNIIISIIIALLVGLLIFFVARSLVSALQTVLNYVDRVAHGQFSMPLALNEKVDKLTRSQDEIGILSRGIKSMVENIQKLFIESEQKTNEALEANKEAQQAIEESQKAQMAEASRREAMQEIAEQLKIVADRVTEASTNLAKQIRDADMEAVDSSHHIGEAAAAMNEMNATVQEVAHNASVAALESLHTKEKAISGADIVERSLSSIEEVHQCIKGLKNDMLMLNEHTQNITKIMNVISDIADQTNLLALNAAIEAARAGEAGRGFAVVADEVRKLAEKTMSSTNEVSSAIMAIKESASKSMQGVDLAVQAVDTTSKLANESGIALNEIVVNVNNTSSEVQAIATASEEQSAASEEINQSITRVNAMSANIARKMNEAADAVADLADQAMNIGKFAARMQKD